MCPTRIEPNPERARRPSILGRLWQHLRALWRSLTPPDDATQAMPSDKWPSGCRKWR